MSTSATVKKVSVWEVFNEIMKFSFLNLHINQNQSETSIFKLIALKCNHMHLKAFRYHSNRMKNVLNTMIPQLINTEHDISVDSGISRVYKCFGCWRPLCDRRHHRAHLNGSENCRKMNLEYLISADDSEIPSDSQVCFGCGNLVTKSPHTLKAHFKAKPSCVEQHWKVIRERKTRHNAEDGMVIDHVNSNDWNEERKQKNVAFRGKERDVGEQDNDEFVWPELYCVHRDDKLTFCNLAGLNRHIREVGDCFDTHIRNFLKSGDRVTEGYSLCTNCGFYVRDGNEKMHVVHPSCLKKGCTMSHFTKGGEAQRSQVKDEVMLEKSERQGGRAGKMWQVEESVEESEELTSDEEDVEMMDLEEVIKEEELHPSDRGNVNLEEEERSDKADVAERLTEKEEIRVKVERVSSSELLSKVDWIETPELHSKESSPSISSLSHSPSDNTSTPSKPKVSYFNCSKCDTKTKDRAYLKKHYRAHHCQVGCGDYDLICTACVKALKQIVTFPRGLEGYDYRKFNTSKDGLKCPKCTTFSQKHNTQYIRSHYREQHCKIGCSKYDQICTGCVAVLEKLTVWPKPLVGHDYSTGPPPVGFQCPNCKKGIEKKYFKRHFRHLHCKAHCIEKEEICKKCSHVFKRMNM